MEAKTNKKKILFLNNTFSRAGAEMVLLDIFYLLDPEKYDISFFVLSDQGELKDELPDYVKLLNPDLETYSCLTPEGFETFKRKLYKRMLKKGVFVKDVPYVLKYRKIADIQKLARRFLADAADVPEEIKNTEYDLAVAFVEGGAPWYMKKNVHAKKKCAFIHVDYTQAGYSRELDQGVYDDTDKVFAISGEVRESFIKEYPEFTEKTEVLPNVISVERVKKKSKEQGAGFSDGFTGFRIMTVARLYPQKALDVSVRAAAILRDKGLDFRWHVFGDGVERESLERLTEELTLTDRMFFPGMTDNPYAYLAGADLYVHATAFEGKSIAIREAQILGRPIVLTDCSGNREQAVNMESGLFCELSEQDIARKIMLLHDDPELRKKLGENASRIDQGANELNKLYELLE